MDKFSKLEALATGGGSVGADGKEWTHQVPKPRHLYEGSSDEDFEIAMTDRVQNQSVGKNGEYFFPDLRSCSFFRQKQH